MKPIKVSYKDSSHSFVDLDLFIAHEKNQVYQKLELIILVLFKRPCLTFTQF